MTDDDGRLEYESTSGQHERAALCLIQRLLQRGRIVRLAVAFDAQVRSLRYCRHVGDRLDAVVITRKGKIRQS